jgi:chromosomal replication initiation ATPase DnaA
MTEEQKLAAIVAAVAADQNVPAEAIRGRRRTREVLQARHLATALAYEFLPALTVPEIAQLMGKTQHSTVANSLRVCRKPKEAEMYARLRAVLAGYIGLPR